MIGQYAVLSKNIEDFVYCLIESLNVCSEDELYEKTKESLAEIVNRFGTEEYGFNLAMELFVEKSFVKIKIPLIEIINVVNEDSFNAFSCDKFEKNIIFAAYYAISLIYKKEHDIDGLKSLIDEKYDFLQSYPLRFEVLSRCYKRIDNLREALECDRSAINILKRQEVYNHAVRISFASTICSMCEAGVEVDDSDFSLAISYTDDAIKYNPNYPKYYFTKAKLIHYSNRNKSLSPCETASIQKIIYDLLGDAEATLFYLYDGTSSYTKTERMAYEKFRNKVKNEYKNKFNQINENDVSRRKQEIINSDSQKASYHPPLPELNPSDKYVYVCYSPMDYKSVYCDLIELYVNKICFKYDPDLNFEFGKNWEKQLEERIIANENCKGVIFYISKNTIISDGLCKEINKVRQWGLPYFCVNLEGNTLPSKVAIDAIFDLANDPDAENPSTLANNLKAFLNAFDDDGICIAKMAKNNDDGNVHISKLINAITNTFEA